MRILFFLLISSISMADDINSNNTIVIKPQATTCCKVRTVIKKQFVDRPVIVEKSTVVYKTKYIVKKESKKNRLSLLLGVGPTHLSQPSVSQVDLIKGPVGGLQYQHMLGETMNVGIQLQTNQSVLGSVGFDF
jgi:hypothetical protein